MSTCQRCATSDWHPDVKRCTFVDCELLHSRLTELRGPDASQAGAPFPLCGAPAPLSLRAVPSLPLDGSLSGEGGHSAALAGIVEGLAA